MSLQTTLARGAARAAAENWRSHRNFCIHCGTATRRRRWDDLCPDGSELRAQMAETEAALQRERDLDKVTILPGQGMLFDWPEDAA